MEFLEKENPEHRKDKVAPFFCIKLREIFEYCVIVGHMSYFKKCLTFLFIFGNVWGD